MEKTKSDFFDFCQKGNKEVIKLWKKQAKLHDDITFYWDRKQKVFCRKVSNVKGKVIDGWFYPEHWLIKYKQKVI